MGTARTGYARRTGHGHGCPLVTGLGLLDWLNAEISESANAAAQPTQPAMAHKQNQHLAIICCLRWVRRSGATGCRDWSRGAALRAKQNRSSAAQARLHDIDLRQTRRPETQKPPVSGAFSRKAIPQAAASSVSAGREYASSSVECSGSTCAPSRFLLIQYSIGRLPPNTSPRGAWRL